MTQEERLRSIVEACARQYSGAEFQQAVQAAISAEFPGFVAKFDDAYRDVKQIQ